MIVSLERFIARLFGGNSYVATFIIAMLPIIEVKGAVPFGMSEELFGASRLSAFSASMAAAVGSFVPAIFLVGLFKRVVSWLSSTKTFGRVCRRLQDNFKEKASAMGEKGRNHGFLARCFALVCFVALPLPLTGAYTGSAVASFMGLGYFSSLVCVLVGNIICAFIMALVCTVFRGYENYVVLGFLGLVVVAIVARLLHKKLSKIKTHI